MADLGDKPLSLTARAAVRLQFVHAGIPSAGEQVQGRRPSAAAGLGNEDQGSRSLQQIAGCRQLGRRRVALERHAKIDRWDWVAG